jgi:hypothetical protein
MRCLFKLTVAVCLAVVAQVLVQPGGVGDEVAFATRVYMGVNVFGFRLDSPEMVDAAARLIERQGSVPESVRKPRQCPAAQIAPTELTAAGTDRPSCETDDDAREVACAR